MVIHYQKKIGEIYQKDKFLSESIPVLKIIMTYFGLCESYVLLPLLNFPQIVLQDIIKQVKANGIME